ncbi:peptidase U32 family protein [Xylocopilactobacillus apis]|uniref:Protease n=1 Tax=Xylocopilactobacillus apis TaxID=2932183 RepID=A0AAU9D0N9_9LACO|nr:peptidase U32 family protein [Xylocopilactobacillus apis]BDR55850.1 protease [Xylocopilactobacillus apis]
MKDDSLIRFSSTVPVKDIAGTVFDEGIDALIIGNNRFGLRLPTSYDLAETADLTKIAHQKGKKIIVAANAILHNEKLQSYQEYLAALDQIEVDYVMVGDAGAVNIIQNNFPNLKFIYNGEVLDTNSGMMNFWGEEGASYVQLSREIPYVELKELLPKLEVKPILQLFGPIAIEHSGRSLIYNYLDYVDKTNDFAPNEIYKVSLPARPEEEYIMFEDEHGTHMYAPYDLNLLSKFLELVSMGINFFTFDSKFYDGDNWLNIIKIFVKARNYILQDQLNDDRLSELEEKLLQTVPADRKYSIGFYDYQIGDIK